VNPLIRRLLKRDRRADKIVRLLSELEAALQERQRPARAALTIRAARN
jgi:hypothetical protein